MRGGFQKGSIMEVMQGDGNMGNHSYHRKSDDTV